MNKKLTTLLCVLVLLISTFCITAAAVDAGTVATIGNQNYTSLENALAAVDTESPAATVVTLQKDAGAVVFDKTVYLDLNGCSIASVSVAEGCTLYCMDSETDDYQIEGNAETGYTGFGRIVAVAAESKGKLEGVAAGTVPVVDETNYPFGYLDSYLKVEEAGKGYSFHRVNLQITAMTLRHKNEDETAYNPGLYYKSDFAGDQLVAANVSKFGVALSVAEMPSAENFGVNNKCSVFENFVAGANGNADSSTSTLLKSVLKESNGRLTNTSHSQMPVFGRAYVRTSNGDYVFGMGVKRSFKEQITLMCNDVNWAKLSDTQVAESVSLYKKYTQLFKKWEVANLESAVIIDKNHPVCEGDTLKILAITSSFGLNTTQLLYDVAIAEGYAPENVIVARLYASGCTLKKHIDHAPSTPLYQYSKVTGDPAKTETPGIMTTIYQEGYATLLDGLQDEDWDIIFMQQGAAQAPRVDTYEDYIDQLKVIVDENKTNPDARFVWNMLWGYQSDSTQDVFVKYFDSNQMLMYNGNVNATLEKVVPRTDYNAIIPTGTVIQNARTSFFGDNLCRDTYHLNNLGATLAAYGLFATITGRELTEINIDIVTATANNGIRSSGSPAFTEQLTEAQKAVIIESVNNALKNPFHVTLSQHTEA